jgi:hypothetical protein
MEGSVLRFLKAEWKVSDTGSAHWASSLIVWHLSNSKISLLTDRDEMSNVHRGHSIDDSYQVSVVAMVVNRSGWNEKSEGSVLSFLKAEWKVSDTGSAHWASSLIVWHLSNSKIMN